VVEVACGGTGRGFTVRVLLATPGGGPSIEDCARASRALGDHFEALGLFSGPYHLEVSSPGVDRPLTRASDYDKFAGEQVEVTTFELLDGRHRHAGRLVGYDAAADEAVVAGDAGEMRIPLGAIRRAHLRRDPWAGRRSEKREKKRRRPRRGGAAKE